MLNIRDGIKEKQKNSEFEIALVGNPNVGKSSIFNALTGLKQHTGNWTGKTVSSATGYYKHKNVQLKVVDLPGTYSLNALSEEEIIAKNYIESEKASCIIIIADATNIERNLNLTLQILSKTSKVILCLNMIDEAQSKGISIDTDELSLQLGIPVINTSAIKKVGFNKLKNTINSLCNNEIKTFDIRRIKEMSDIKDNERYTENIYKMCSEISSKCVYKKSSSNNIDSKIDRVVTSKFTGIAILLALLFLLFWITIVGANYISEILSTLFDYIKIKLQNLLELLYFNQSLISFIVDGIYTTLSWVVAVMLPPMAIFFPIFSLLEDSGFLPRIAFNLDSCFKNCGAHGKQSLTMAMGFGCNACGVVGCRIIDSKKEKNIAILTNNFMPCNGRLPSLIAIISIFIATTYNSFLNSVITSLTLLSLITFSVFITLITSKILSNTILKGQSSSFILELPPYRKPQFIKTIIYALKDRALFVLLRAVMVAIPAGALIWCLANIKINDYSILSYCTDFFEPFGKAIGLDGVIVIAFILGFPANETVIPIMLMAYLSTVTLTDYTSLSELSTLLVNNGWTIITAICFLVICIFHFPCSTTVLTIYKETKSIYLTFLSIIIPTIIGVVLCFIINSIYILLC
ncbi:MAG: ferrous iron transporter B [Ruminococcus sp.]|nr:ferrous iron transporter B [Ruminococcus sp.]